MVWKEIEGYKYRYRIGDEGVIQKYDDKKGWIAIKPYYHRGILYVRLRTTENTQKKVSVFRLIDNLFFNGYAKKNGLVMTRISDIKDDFSVGNIYFTTRKELGKKNGCMGTRKAVLMEYKGRETLYKSVREAARKNGMTTGAIIRRIRKQVFDQKGRQFKYA